MLSALAARWNTVGGRRDLTPVPSRCDTDVESVRSQRPNDWLEHHTAREHAQLLVSWIRRNVELERGMIFHEAMQEYYAEAVIDAGWAAKPWNPIAREMDLICTGGKKPYVWVMTPTGRMRRRRYYPIPSGAELRRVA